MKNILLLLGLILLINCHSIEIQIENEVNPAVTVKESKKAFTAGLGLIPITKPFEPKCIEKANKVLIKRDFIDIGIHLIANPFLSSKTMHVYCPN